MRPAARRRPAILTAELTGQTSLFTAPEPYGSGVMIHRLIPAVAAGAIPPSPRRVVAKEESRAAAARAALPFALAGFSGVLFATAFPPLSWTAAAWVSLVPLFTACASLSPRRAAIAGMCWTALAATGVASFLPAMLSGYFGLGPISSWTAALVIALGLHGLFVSVFAAWLAWLTQRGGAHPWLIAGGWLVCELARSGNPLGSPWALAATSQVPWITLIQSVDLAGPFAVGMLVAAVNALLASACVPALRGGRIGLSTLSIIGALAAVLLYGEIRLRQDFSVGAPVGVAVVQGGATPAQPSQRAARLARYAALSSERAAPNADLILWPEHALDGYLQEPSRTRAAVLRVAAGTGADLLVGGPHYEASPNGTRYHNSAHLVRDGGVAGRYDKRLLVPFAEDDRVARALGAAPSGYTPGQGGLVLAAHALRLGPLLCVEAMFPALARQAVEHGAELLVTLSNDTWFVQPAAARQQLDLAVLRAVENRRYLVRAASTGFSAVIDPHGRTVARSELDTFDVLNTTVRAAHARTPYQRWGEAFAWLVLAAVTLATLRTELLNARQQPRRIE